LVRVYSRASTRMSVGRFLQQAAAGAADASDDDFANVVLLLDGDGTSGDNNETFTDSSTNGFTVTENGSVVQGSFSPYGDNWSNYFDGNEYLISDTAAPAIGTNDFTIEFWYNGGAQPNRFPSIVGTLDAFSATGAWRVHTYVNNTSSFQFTYGITNYQFTTTDYNDGVWRHFAVTREGTNLKGFVNGVQQGSTLTFSGSLSSRKIMVAGQLRDNDHQEGFISNVRVINGTALYTSDFTPPTAPLTAVTNTDFLGCQSNRFLDNSTNNLALSTSGTPKVTPFSPFKNDDARTLTTDGGSGYFDDSSNSYLQIADNSVFDATTSLCIEAWFYMTSSPGSGPDAHAVVSKWVSTTPGQRTMFIDIEDTGLRAGFDIQGASNPVIIATDGGAISQGEWHHVAVTWDGSTYRAFLDGVLEGSTSNSNAPIASSQVVRVGYNTNTHYFGGYITDVRWITDGGAIYTSGFTPPTSPLTAITNTELLLNFQDAGIYDRSGINNLDTVGNAQIDTAVKKYGTGSMEFDGTGDYLKTVENEALELGSGDWTIEFWVYFDAVNNSTVKYLFDWRTATDTSNSFLAQEGTNNWTYWNASGSGVSSGFTSSTFSASTWHHVAIAREGSNIYFFVDGTKTSGSVSDTSNYDSGTLVIGSRYNGQNYLDGYIDDLRITKGIARYTSNFTPPDAALGKF